MRWLGILFFLVVTASAQERKLDVRVDPRVELMSTIFRLAGNSEYNKPSSKSPYADAVDAHFGAFGEHGAVTMARELRQTRGVSFDAVMSLAVHLTDAETLAELLPFDKPGWLGEFLSHLGADKLAELLPFDFDKQPPRLDGRWRADEVRAFLREARDFVRETKFLAFQKQYEELHTTAARRLRDKLNERSYLEWFDKFFGPRTRAEFYVILGMLNGGANYGVGVRYRDGREQITPVLGAATFDKEGVPLFDDSIVPLVVHEFAHSYTSPLVDRFKTQLAVAGRRIYPHRAAVMRRQAYGSWKVMMDESLVRACVVRYLSATDGEQTAAERVAYEHEKGFTWTGELVQLLDEYETNRAKFPTLESFMPRIVDFFDAHAQQVQPLSAPRIVSLTPANGSIGVDPAIKAITVTFDRPMMDRAWSLVRTDAGSYPEVTGMPQYGPARKVLTIPVRLKPATTYHLYLNSEQFSGFKSAEGIPLCALGKLCEFSTFPQHPRRR